MEINKDMSKAEKEPKESRDPREEKRSDVSNVKSFDKSSNYPVKSQKSETSDSRGSNEAVSKGSPASTAKSDWIGDINQSATNMDHTIQSFVKKSPVAAVAIAVGVGFLGSMIFSKLTATSTEGSSKNLKEAS